MKGVLHTTGLLLPTEITIDPQNLVLTTRTEYVQTEFNLDIVVTTEERWTRGDPVSFNASPSVYAIDSF